MLIKQFEHISELIKSARRKAYKSVNKELIELYWKVGQYISERVAAAEWGKATVQQLADYIKIRHPETRGFSRRSLFRMRQFYEAYCDNQFVPTLLAQISWSSHIDILSKTKTDEERGFYIRLAIKENSRTV